MSRNGSGVYSLPSPQSPAVAGTTIVAADRNTIDTDIATALTQSLAADGQTTVTANLPLAGFKLTGVGAATARTDAATLAVIQDGVGVYVATVGGTVDAITLTPSPAITAYAAGQRFSFIAAGANTGATTVTISGIGGGAKSITKNGTTALVASDIPSGALVTIEYDGTRFQLSGTVPSQTAAQILALLVTVDGAGSGLDADLLDGISSAAFAEIAQARTISGLWNYTTQPTINSILTGYLSIPQNSQSGNYGLVLGDSGYHIYHPSGAGAGDTYTIPANASVAYPVGTAITFVNADSNSISIAITTDTLTLAGTTTTGTRTLAQNGTATAIKHTTTGWIISGVGLT